MKRYTEKHLILWKDNTWVVCPQCKKIATTNNYSIHCSHCGFEKNKNEFLSFTAIAKLNCPNCATPIYEKQENLKEKKDTITVKCNNCLKSFTVKPQHEEYYNSPYNLTNSALKCDSVFGLPYFFQDNVRGNLFWANNLSHLKAIEDYISSTLRERDGMTMVAKLPTFIKVKKNRELILKILRKWKQTIAQPQYIIPSSIADKQIYLFFQNPNETPINYLKNIPYELTYASNYTSLHSCKNGFESATFWHNNRIKRIFTDEWKNSIPFPIKNIHLYYYFSSLDFAKEVLSLFLLNYLKENTHHSLYISIGENIYSAETLSKTPLTEILPF